MTLLTRETMLADYEKILRRKLSAATVENYLRTGNFGSGIIVQSSSGSSGKDIVKIPRSPSDIQDIFRRTLVPYFEVFTKAPERIAMLGGVSHLEAANKFKIQNTAFVSFGLEDLVALEEYNPDLISCYPSIARELVGKDIKLPSLNAMKLGGEPLFEADLITFTRRFGALEFFEQVGSTEMPAIALGRREIGKPRRLHLQTKRFAFQQLPTSDWQPLVAKDLFPELLFDLNGFYDMGDEVRLEGEYLLDIRRKNDLVFPYREMIEELLRAGVENLQIRESEVLVTKMPAFTSITGNGRSFQIRPSKLERISSSNKLPMAARRS